MSCASPYKVNKYKYDIRRQANLGRSTFDVVTLKLIRSALHVNLFTPNQNQIHKQKARSDTFFASSFCNSC